MLSALTVVTTFMALMRLFLRLMVVVGFKTESSLAVRTHFVSHGEHLQRYNDGKLIDIYLAYLKYNISETGCFCEEIFQLHVVPCIMKMLFYFLTQAVLTTS